MNRAQKLLNNIKSGNASWLDFSDFLNLESEALEQFFNLAQNITQRKL